MAIGFPEAWAKAEPVEGWLTLDQGRALFEAAQAVGSGRWIVEIGSHHGRSTLLLAAAKNDGVQLLAVDPFDDPRWGGGAAALTTFQATLRGAGLLDQVDAFSGVSADASATWDRGPIGMLFVDGAHDRASVLTDIDGWAPHLADDASIFFHDAYSSPGVTVALFERYFGRPRGEYLGSAGSLAHIKNAPLRRGSRAISAARMLGRLPWFARNLAIKIAIRRGWGLTQRALRHSGAAYPY